VLEFKASLYLKALLVVELEEALMAVSEIRKFLNIQRG
jgi:hypothetical protein